MKLSSLLRYNNIIIQCHDNPDADALASGMALLTFFKSKNKNVRFVYGGRYQIQKSNLLLMVKDLGIEVHYVNDQAELSTLLGLEEGQLPDLLVTVDCQYGEGNVFKFSAKKVAVIDHHQLAGRTPKLSEIRTQQASCSTIVWDMLRNEKFNVNSRSKLATALYYGLMSDSGNFSEINHPLDKDMRDELKFNRAHIVKFKNSNISQNELKIAGLALLGYEYYKSNRYAIVRTEPCDPNILGVISDMLLEVDSVDACLVYNVSDGGVKISVRSCTVEIRANELAEYICESIGSGGGHVVKAGGFIQRRLLEKRHIVYEDAGIHDFLRGRMQSYFDETEIIYASRYKLDISTMKKYTRKPVELGYVLGTDIVPANTEISVRTVDGDKELEINQDSVLLVDGKGQVNMIKKAYFDANMDVDDKDEFVFAGEYSPTIKSLSNGKIYPLLKYAKSCVYVGDNTVLAKELSTRVKIFPTWDKENYSVGRPGDYIVMAPDSVHDLRVVEKSIFMEAFE